MTIFNLPTKSGKNVSYDSEKKAGSGTMKEVFFSPDKSYVIAFYKKPVSPEGRQRLECIIGQYQKSIFDSPNGDYWRDILCWVTDIVEHEGKLGIVLPAYHKGFLFEYGSYKDDICSIKGKPKEGRWFASARHQQVTLDLRERGNWKNYLQICLCIARGVQRLHASGLAHSDLSYKNILVDPISETTKGACIIDIDGLVVPSLFPPDVEGTPDFVAPEVLATNHLCKNDPDRKVPNIRTDLHALAVLIYQYLLYRHPLRGGKCHDSNDPNRDESLLMGEKALFIEHPTDVSNRPNLRRFNSDYLPWADVQSIPYTITGQYLKELFDRSFIDGLHVPHRRPDAGEWVQGLVKTMDLLLPCRNPSCQQKWYVYDGTKSPKCPFCKKVYTDSLPILNFYSRNKGKIELEDHRFMVYKDQPLFLWHVNRNIFPNERLTPEQQKPVGYFSQQNGKWVFVNQALDSMLEIMPTKEKISVPIGSTLEIKDNQQIHFLQENGGRGVKVQMLGQ